MWHPWLLERCKEVQANPNGYGDFWARGHYKSTIITFGLTIMDIFASHGDDPLTETEDTFGFFSFNRPIAKQFLSQIKREFETNEFLKEIFPDILWQDPNKESPRWSEDPGILVKRRSNPKELTIEAWGVVEGQPTSKHFGKLLYDDLVTIDNVRSPEMIKKTTDSTELSFNLGAKGAPRRFVGTFYHFKDTYRELIDRGAIKPRIYPATVDGLPDGVPVLLEPEELAKKRKEQGPYTFGAQMLLNPIADDSQGFKQNWIQFHQVTSFSNLNKYIVIDPANEKKKTSDYTVMIVVGLGGDQNYYILDIIRDRLNLTERADALFHLHRKYRPLNVGYEKYGMQADLDYIKERMRQQTYNFRVTELGGKVAKNDRIRALIPYFEQNRVFLPESCYKTLHDKKTYDLTDIFINQEYMTFPYSGHDDMLDALARMLDKELAVIWPRFYENTKKDRYARKRAQGGGSSWSA